MCICNLISMQRFDSDPSQARWHNASTCASEGRGKRSDPQRCQPLFVAYRTPNSTIIRILHVPVPFSTLATSGWYHDVRNLPLSLSPTRWLYRENTKRENREGQRERERETEEHGEVSMLWESSHQQGRLDQGRGRAPRRPHPSPRRGRMAYPPEGRRPPAVRQELPSPLDQLSPPRPQARQLHPGRGWDHHQPPPSTGQQVSFSTSVYASRGRLLTYV